MRGVVETWTGREAMLLQSVLRLSNRDYASALGMSHSTVMKWRRQGADLVLLPRTQQVLDDALLKMCTPHERAVFHTRLAEIAGHPDTEPAVVPGPRDPLAAGFGAGGCTVTSHKFIPVYLGPDRAAAIGRRASAELPGPGGLERRILPVDHPDGQARLHLYDLGVAVLHLAQVRHPATITELAVWRYRTYLTDRAWTGRLLAQLLDGTHRSADLAPEYVLSAYELGAHPYGEHVHTALQLLATPSVLVDRRNPDNITPLDPANEQNLFAQQWAHPDAVEFAGAVSPGLAGWSGLAYHPLPAERALTTADIVDLELDVQALWTLSGHVMAQLPTDASPVTLPGTWGHGHMRAAYARLTQSGPTETVQHRLMRKAVLATSELPERLAAAQDALRS